MHNTTLWTGSAARPRAIAVDDFTNDGLLDVAIVNYGTHNIDVMYKHENGSFSVQRVYSADFAFNPEAIVATDFNNDSYLDVAIANPAADDIRVLYGEGNGTFGNDMIYSTGYASNPQSIAVGDFNNDDQQDIVVVHSGTKSVGILLKADSAAFESIKTFPTGSLSKPQGIAVGDFNNDRQLDITVANNGNANIGFFFGLGDGTFSSQSTVFLGEGVFPGWVGVADFNNDKQLDVIVTVNIRPSPIIVLLGHGDGSFRITETYGVAGATSAAVVDFNHDGRLDIVVTNYFDQSVTILLGYGDGTFGNQTNYSTGYGSRPQFIAVGDFNNDNRLDIAVVNSIVDNVGILLGYGNGTFAPQQTVSNGGTSVPWSITVADFNNDMRLDIAVANLAADNVGVFSWQW